MFDQAAYNQRRRERWRANGMCQSCGRIIEAGREGKSRCLKCTRTQTRYFANYRAERIANGLCVRCGKVPPEPGIKTCRACRDKANEECRRSRERAKAARRA